MQAICYRLTAKAVKIILNLKLIRVTAALAALNCSLGTSLSLASFASLVSLQPAYAEAAADAAAATIDLSDLLSKSLTAYGGEENVAQIAAGFNVFGKEYDNVSQGLPGGLDLSQVESRPSDSSFRLMRKGVRWRLDHERGDTLNNGVTSATLTEGFNGEIPWVQAGARSSAKAEDLQIDSAKLLNLETTLPATFVMEGLRLVQTDAKVQVEEHGSSRSVDQVVLLGSSNLRGTPVCRRG